MKIDDLPLVSIVTPVYNGEKYLEECIQSVRKQTYQNWEYIILNNCSTDRTLEIAQNHQAQDERIQVYNTDEVLPLIKNHNHALRQISPESKYCKVVHADDWLFPQCIQLMVSLSESYPTVGIVGSYGLWGDLVVCDRLPFPSHLIRGPELCRITLLGLVNPFWSPTSLLIRSDIVRGRTPFYNGVHLHADVGACYEILRDCDFGFVHQVLTFIRSHEESMTSRVAAPLNTMILSNFDFLMQYGPIYLNQDEYRKRLSVKTQQYYRFLARSLFQLRELDFWKFHKKSIQEIGLRLSSIRLARAVFIELVERPKRSVALFLREIINKSSNARKLLPRL